MRHSMFIGRFQPFHDGHEWCVREMLSNGKRVCIAIMDIHDLEPIKNPYTTEEVKQNIDNQLKDLINQGIVKTIIIPLDQNKQHMLKINNG